MSYVTVKNTSIQNLLLYYKNMHANGVTYKEVLSIPTNMELNTFNITPVSAIGSPCGTYGTEVFPIKILSYLCRDEAFFSMSVSNYETKISVWCGRNTQCGGGKSLPARQALTSFTDTIN
jgi:hypothetical protein